MITRRQFNHLTAAAGLGLIAAPHVARAQNSVVRLGNASGLIDAQITFLTVGQNPKTPFYKDEGCAMDIVNLGGAAQSIQALVAGHVDTTAVSPQSLCQESRHRHAVLLHLAAPGALVDHRQA
jgi:ABC-type nitrate/sulfonate/bicarbonate transport system substrate-binding protein